MTIASRNAGYSVPAYFEQGGQALRVRVNDGLAASLNTGLIGSEDELWHDCPIISYLLDQTLGNLCDEPFVNYDATNDWTLTQATAGSAAISTTVPAVLTLDSGDTTAHHGVQIQRKVATFLPAAGKSIWFEVQVEPTFLTGEFFLGLAAVDTTIIAAGAMTTNNRIGWTGVAGDGVLQFDCDKAGTGNQSTGVTLSTTAWHSLGFFYDGVADTIQQYIDGVAVGSPITTANIPKAAVIYPSFVCQNHATDEVTMTIRALRVFQLR